MTVDRFYSLFQVLFFMKMRDINRFLGGNDECASHLAGVSGHILEL